MWQLGLGFLTIAFLYYPALATNPLGDITIPFISIVDTFYRELSNGVKSDCQEQANFLIKASKDAQAWAIQVADASGHPDSGLLNGGLTYPGLYSECVRVRVNTTSQVRSQFRGQHCLGDITFYGNQDFPPHGMTESLWNTVVNNSLKVGLCFPSSCGIRESEIALNSSINLLFQNATFDLKIDSCSNQSYNFHVESGPVVVIVLLVFLMSLSIVGTSYDIIRSFTNSYGCFVSWPRNRQKSNSDVEVNNPSTEALCKVGDSGDGGTWSRVLLSFSVKRNGANILRVNKEQGSVDIFHGLRFLSMLWIITGHSCSFALSWVTFKNPKQLNESGSNFLSQILENGTFSVDTFFYLSGFLVVFVSMKNLKKLSSKLNVLMAVVHRYIRMTPLMMIVIAFTANLLQYVGKGPFWLSSIQMYDSWCRKNWWINLFYLQNFVNTNTMCLSHSWYSAADFQFFIVAVLVLYILNKNSKAGLISIGVLLGVSISITAYLIAENNYPPVPYIGNVVSQELANAFSSNVYIKPYCRMGPYLIGMALGYFLRVNKEGFVLPKKFIVLGWILAILINLTILFSTWPAYLGHIPKIAEAASYGSIARTGWAVGLSWLTFACISGYGGFANTILSWRVFVPLSRLTYCAYLIHPIVMSIFYGSRQISFDFSELLLLYFVLGNLVITYILAFILSVLFESPFISLEKIFMKSR